MIEIGEPVASAFFSAAAGKDFDLISPLKDQSGEEIDKREVLKGYEYNPRSIPHLHRRRAEGARCRKHKDRRPGEVCTGRQHRSGLFGQPVLRLSQRSDCSRGAPGDRRVDGRGWCRRDRAAYPQPARDAAWQTERRLDASHDPSTRESRPCRSAGGGGIPRIVAAVDTSRVSSSRMVMVEPPVPGWRCSHCAPQRRLGRRNSASPRVSPMPRWSPSPRRSSRSGPGVLSERLPRPLPGGLARADRGEDEGAAHQTASSRRTSAGNRPDGRLERSLAREGTSEEPGARTTPKRRGSAADRRQAALLLPLSGGRKPKQEVVAKTTTTTPGRRKKA